MGYLIDTNILSELRKKERIDPNVRAWFSDVEEKSCFVSVLSVGEIINGIERLKSKDAPAAASLQNWLNTLLDFYADRILPITPEIARQWGVLTAPRPLPVIDSLIAATAIVHNLTLVTRNTKDVEKTGAALLNPFL